MALHVFHSLILTARSERAGSKGGKSDESKASIEKPSTKLLVRNIPFQVTTTDMRCRNNIKL